MLLVYCVYRLVAFLIETKNMNEVKLFLNKRKFENNFAIIRNTSEMLSQRKITETIYFVETKTE